MQTTTKIASSVFRRPRVASIGIILAFAAALPVCFAPKCFAEEPPPDLAKRVAQRATETRNARAAYTYRQTFTEHSITDRGMSSGQYREVRDVVFLANGERSEVPVGKVVNTLKDIKLTDEDFQDAREVQPFLYDTEQLFLYETRPKGEETIDGVDCWVLQVRPRQILAGQRLFDGLLWASKKDFSIVHSEGKAVPDLRSMKVEKENLFPRFTTTWAPIDGSFWFPVRTYADNTLDFRVGPRRIRLEIRYSNYKKFSAESTIKFEEEHK